MSENPSYIWFDGKLTPWDEANVHVLTHTLHYGLGVFEGIRAYKCDNGQTAVLKLDEHLKRLYASCHIADIRVPYDIKTLKKAVIEVLLQNGLDEAYIRPIIFIGHGTMGVNPKDNPIRVAIAAWPWGAYLGDDGLEKGIRTKISTYTRMNVNSFMTKAKICGNYVNSVFAKTEAISQGFDEAIMLDTEGYVSEGSGENIFIIRDGLVKTPPLTSILEGITRKCVIDIAADENIKITEQRFTRDELYTSDEIFLTGTAAEITPIREIDGRMIGTGKPGKITKLFQKRYFNIIKGNDSKFISWLEYL
ncbi:MAG: branched-chain amino acid transaminase [Candidatus Dadabacteria bacterium]|nr:branched-chain amino acid transaminase [Candidatus Dadabacteria bacterium]NIQ13854.1 branched-chain amino acid transaminase [Candidatus Dadabacteria bacterium]